MPRNFSVFSTHWGVWSKTQKIFRDIEKTKYQKLVFGFDHLGKISVFSTHWRCMQSILSRKSFCFDCTKPEKSENFHEKYQEKLKKNLKNQEISIERYQDKK